MKFKFINKKRIVLLTIIIVFCLIISQDIFSQSEQVYAYNKHVSRTTKHNNSSNNNQNKDVINKAEEAADTYNQANQKYEQLLVEKNNIEGKLGAAQSVIKIDKNTKDTFVRSIYQKSISTDLSFLHMFYNKRKEGKDKKPSDESLRMLVIENKFNSSLVDTLKVLESHRKDLQHNLDNYNQLIHDAEAAKNDAHDKYMELKKVDNQILGDGKSIVCDDSACSNIMSIVNKEIQSPSQNWYDRCESFVDYILHNGASYATANAHWQGDISNGSAHPGDRNPPAGKLVFFKNSNSAGHVAISLGNGMIASTDILGRGKVGIVTLNQITNGIWHLEYRGWGN